MKIGLKSSCEKSWRVLWFDHSLFQNLRASRGTGIQEIQNGIGSCTLASGSLPRCSQNCFTAGGSWNWRVITRQAETVFSLPGRQSLPLVPKFCISGEARIISEPSDYQTGAQRWSRSEDMQGSKPGPMKKFWWCSNELFLCTIHKQIKDLSLSLHNTDAKSLANIKNQQAKFMRLKKKTTMKSC